MENDERVKTAIMGYRSHIMWYNYYKNNNLHKYNSTFHFKRAFQKLHYTFSIQNQLLLNKLK
jgi:hypothetical protein